MEGIARVVRILGSDSNSLVDPDKALANVRIRSAAAFSVSIKGDLDDPQLSPVLFARHVAEENGSDGSVISENQQILTSIQSQDFSSQFAKSGGKTGTFLLSSGEYVYVEPSLRQSLTALHTVIKGDAKVRRAFVKAPRAVMSELMDDHPSVVDALHFNFIETAEFSDRVLGVDHWRPAELPFYVSEANDWGTEVLIIRADGQTPISVTKNSLKSALEILKEAKERGEPTYQIEGQTVQVSDRLINIIADLLPESPDDPNPTPTPEPEPEVEPEEPVTGPFAVITRSSFEELNYSPEISAPEHKFSGTQPRALKPSTQLLAHQEAGYEWLISARNTGLPGVIMADDMGLGKTLQALCFLSAYREQVPALRRKPILIVAPTGLLSNWLQEIDTHLIAGGLGNVLRVFGTKIRELKSGKGRDTDSGIPMLDIGRLRSSDVVLTTYETARDYQQSFAQIEFGVAVFDEIQKAKNPRSFIRQGLRDKCGVQNWTSGTPVENSIADYGC